MKGLAALLLAGSLVLGAVACGSEDTQNPAGDGGNGGSGGSGGTGGSAAGSGGGGDGGGGSGGEVVPGPTVDALDRAGLLQLGRTAAVLPSTTKDLVLIGTMPTPLLDGGSIGLPGRGNASGVWFEGGLVALHPSTGELRRYTKDDGLPTQRYVDGPIDYGDGIAPLFDLAWIEDGSTFVAAAWDHLVRGAIAGDGAVTFTSVKLEGTPSVGHVAVAGGLVFAGTEEGLFVRDAADLSAKRGVALPEGDAWVTALATTGDRVAALSAPADGTSPHHVLALNAQDTDAQVIEMPDGESILSLAALDGTFALGVRRTDGRGAVYLLMPAQEGGGMELVADAIPPDLLSPAKEPLLPRRVAYDAVHGRLVIGGALEAQGLVSFASTADGQVSGEREVAFPADDPFHAMLPWNTDVLVVDGQGRWYVGGTQLCSEVKRKTLGLLRVEGQGADRRLVRPFVSGVRSLAVDPEGTTWLGLRDEHPGLTCDGLPVQQQVCRLKADGSCEIVTPGVDAGDAAITPTLGVVDMDFLPEAESYAFASYHEGTYVRMQHGKRALMTQLDPGLSLEETSIAWDAPGKLWVGSQMEYEFYEPPLDEVKINERGPHGLGHLVLDDTGAILEKRRYVRTASDSNDWDVPGLPSNTVWDVLDLPGEDRALVALGVERVSRSLDHVLPEESGKGVLGGLAIVDGAAITAMAAPQGVTLRDVTGLARSAAGVYAVDAEAGVLKVDVDGASSSLWVAAPWDEDERAQAVAADDDGNVAVATTKGLWILGPDGGATQAATGLGAFWSVRFLEPGVLVAGSDQGLVRIALEGHALPASLGPDGTLPRDLWEAPPCEGTAGCACDRDTPCAAWYQCGEDGTCAPDACTRGCMCETATGCPPGWTCQGGIAGFSCNPPAGPVGPGPK